MTTEPLAWDAAASTIPAAVAAGDVSAREVADAALARIERVNPTLNAFTDRTAERAPTEAAAIDARRARGEALGPLGSVPFAVKNLFDI